VEFRPDGTLVEYALGRGDAPEPGPAGQWSADGRITRATGDTARIVVAQPDRLEIDWQE